MKKYDVIVIGAGAAGLIAAHELALAGRNVCLIEAKDTCGGRIKTIYTGSNYPLELGAEFVHGNLKTTLQLLEKAGAKTYEVKGSIWQKKEEQLQEQKDFIEDFSALEAKFKEVREDLSVANFIKEHLQGDKYEELRFSLKNYAEGYYAADLNKASMLAMCEELTKGDDVQYRVENGYRELISYLEEQCLQKGVQFIFSQPVLQLHWKKGEVEAITEESSFKARKAIITVPVGVLQTGGITFSPALTEKKKAAQKLGFGHVIKINFEFEYPFWQGKEFTDGKDLGDLNFLFSKEEIPTWWTQHPKQDNIITGWLGGPKAEALQTLDKETLIRKGLSSLANIFSPDIAFIGKQALKAKFYNWSADPHFNGAYSYAVLDGEKLMQTILEPVESTVYFAGEGLHHGTDIGTVEGALVSGRDVAQNLIAET